MAVKPSWRNRILGSIPSEPIFRRVMSYSELDLALAEAAGIRRMKPEEYAMRAIRAFVEHDLDIDDELHEMEPMLHDLRRGGGEPRRYRGREFGRWRIERLGQ